MILGEVDEESEARFHDVGLRWWMHAWLHSFTLGLAFEWGARLMSGHSIEHAIGAPSPPSPPPAPRTPARASRRMRRTIKIERAAHNAGMR